MNLLAHLIANLLIAITIKRSNCHIQYIQNNHPTLSTHRFFKTTIIYQLNKQISFLR